MKKLTRLFISLFLFIFLSAKADDYVSLFFLNYPIKPEDYAKSDCPSVDDLNSTTLFYYELSVNNLLTDEYYSEKISNLGVDPSIDFNEFNILKTESDSAVCQKLNELFSELGVTQVYDNEWNRYVARWFAMYYETDNRYIVIQHPYNPGDSTGDLAFPVMADSAMFSFDKENLNFIGMLSF